VTFWYSRHQQHSQPRVTFCYSRHLPPRQYSSVKPKTSCNLFLPIWRPDRHIRSAATAFERLHINLCGWCRNVPLYQPNWIREIGPPEDCTRRFVDTEYFSHTSLVDRARKVCKPSMDSASLLVSIKKIAWFGVEVFCWWRHNEGMFVHIWPI